MKGHIQPRGEGAWRVMYTAGRDEKGKRQQRSFTVKGTKRQAEAELRRVLREIDTGTYVETGKGTVGEYLDRWLTHSKTTVAPTTWGGYESYTRTHLIPQLGLLPLAKLSPLAIQEAYDRMRTGGRKDGKGALSARTVRHAHVILHSALTQAVKWQLLARNPCDAVDAPRVENEELASFSEEQIVALFKEMADTPLWVAVVLAVATGCRRGELCGLRWSDVDLERALIYVRRATEVVKGKVSYKEPKTKRSRRAVPLPAFGVDALRRHKGKQAEQRLALGDGYHTAGHVLAWEDGRPLHPDYLTKTFAKVARRLDLPTTRFHALRHTCASLLLNEGEQLKVVSTILGHDDIRTTANIYGHLSPGIGAQAASKLDAAIRRAGGG